MYTLSILIHVLISNNWDYKYQHETINYKIL